MTIALRTPDQTGQFCPDRTSRFVPGGMENVLAAAVFIQLAETFSKVGPLLPEAPVVVPVPVGPVPIAGLPDDIVWDGFLLPRSYQ